MDGGIPSPDKEAEQKEMEEFEKMRGQILAGKKKKKKQKEGVINKEQRAL